MGRPTKKAAAPKQPGRIITNPKQVAAIYEVSHSTLKRAIKAKNVPVESRPRGLEGSRNNHFFDTNEIRAHLEKMGAKPGDSRLARLDRIHRGEE
jgi:phage regulator Rha-like protein